MPFKLLFPALFFFATTVHSQTEQELQDLILKKDSIFWSAYNKCDVSTMGSFITDDVEFYHDKGGPTEGRDSIMFTFKKNLCSNSNFKLRREVVPGTVKVFPMKKDGVTYGAVMSGEHLFYVNEAGKKEFLDGHASFTHLWILKDGEWKMSRILSYDHHAAEQNAGLKEIVPDAAALNKLVGKYKSPNFLIDVANVSGKLILSVEDKVYTLKAASNTEFFMTERDLKFTFTGNKLIVKEHDQVVEEATKQ